MYCMIIQEYIREDGSNPYEKWFNSLDIHAAAKIAVSIARIELGNTSNIKWFEGIGEYKINWGPGYRLFSTRWEAINYFILRWHKEEAISRY